MWNTEIFLYYSFISSVVGGMDTINKMEKIECDEKDRPKVIIFSVYLKLSVTFVKKNN